MITTQITIKGSTIRHMLQKSLQQKAEELEITGTMKVDKDHSITLVATGNKDDLERYIAWCAAAATEHGVAVTETRNLGFKAFYNFSLT
ncbi:acylphosphatase [Niabella drilacis]|uniref:Acylphosphatase n=1 Tax=Niabella drilacis (strain DSM 25811 / CCM 8410 / CCUG 62505 / LMG 26954 / E90) TaxID=1285928 RepID=A0A1G6TV65_NIADE|nr:acylphosphatase [Niabella drilacis]SDD32990.1 acylphosphatase [Niabella drilacis]